MRQYSKFDTIVLGFDKILRTLTDTPLYSGRLYPPNAQAIPIATDCQLSVAELCHSAGLMRINHTGEICAQALYHGHELFVKQIALKQQLQQAALEEGDHLMWCKQRLQELSSRPSHLKLLWYYGAFLLGVCAGLAGDKWVIGFIAETEKQVVEHLTKQLAQLPPEDLRSKAVLQQMQEDEAKHHNDACMAGANALPALLTMSMRLMAKIMVTTAYWC